MGIGLCEACKNWKENLRPSVWDLVRYGRCEEGISRIVAVAGIRGPTSDFSCTLFQPRSGRVERSLMTVAEQARAEWDEPFRFISGPAIEMATDPERLPFSEKRYEIAKSNLAALLAGSASYRGLPDVAVELADALLLALDQEKP